MTNFCLNLGKNEEHNGVEKCSRLNWVIELGILIFDEEIYYPKDSHEVESVLIVKTGGLFD